MFRGSIDILITAGVALTALIIIGLILARMYRRASKETSYVRTGFGGQRVIMNGGALVFPVLHETIPVNMNTLRLEVRRANQQALITKDRMRVDVLAEFYVRVQPTAESIAAAAQTLGQRTMTPSSLKELVEGKFVDALRAVAAEMAMEELHEQRVQFVQKVQLAVSEDLLKNGLELESVSLTGLDQTDKEFFNPMNAFDAEGLTRLTEQIETRRKERNDIEQDTEVAIKNKNLEAERIKLTLSRDEEYARLEQQREVETRRAEQKAVIAREQADKNKEAEQATIVAQRQIDVERIEAERAIEEQRIAKERMLREREIEKNRTIETADIERTQTVELAEQERAKTVELAEQERAIAIAEKSKSQSEAQAEADKARALAVQAAEEVTTVKEAEIAARAKRIELIKAAEQAERDAIRVTVAAEAERKAADDKAAADAIQITVAADAERKAADARATAMTTLAGAEADKIRIAAEGAAQAERLRADAAERVYQVDADGKRSINEASNVLSSDQIAMQVRLALIEALPDIIRESVRPMQQIDGIKIMQVGGLTGRGAASSGTPAGEDAQTGGPTRGNLAEEVVRSALQYRAQAPLVDSLLGELGMSGQDLIQLSDHIVEGPGSAAPAPTNGKGTPS